MEKATTKFKWEQDIYRRVLTSIEVPYLMFKDHLRFLKSKHVKID